MPDSRDYCNRSYPDQSALEEKIDKLTELLCQAGKAYAGDYTPPTEVRKWWSKYRKLDAERGEPW